MFAYLDEWLALTSSPHTTSTLAGGDSQPPSQSTKVGHGNAAGQSHRPDDPSKASHPTDQEAIINGKWKSASWALHHRHQLLVVLLLALSICSLAACSDDPPTAPSRSEIGDSVGLLEGTADDKSPNGTRPAKLIDLSVTSVNSTQMRVSGRLTTLTGSSIAGMSVYVYSVGEAYFTRWSTIYTTSSGNFSRTMSKVPVGSQIQIEVVGNGACSRPYPTFPRP